MDNKKAAQLVHKIFAQSKNRIDSQSGNLIGANAAIAVMEEMIAENIALAALGYTFNKGRLVKVKKA